MSSEVEIVRCADAREQRSARSAHALRFPAHWRAQPVSNPQRDAIELGTLRWLASFEIGESPADREKLRKFECGNYGGYSMPRAPLAEALLVTQFISLWLFWDDVEVEDHTCWSIDDVVQALSSGAADARGPYLAAWADLGRRLSERRDPAWLARLSGSMQHWLENAKLETGLAAMLRERGTLPDAEALFDCRAVSIGMYPTFYLIELAECLELPAEVHAHPVVCALKRTASRLVGMGNDLGGVAKDIEHDWLNVVLALRRSSELGLEAAFARVVEMHNQEVLDFDRMAERLPSFGGELDGRVLRWLEAVRYSVYGFALWESTAERYQEYTALAAGRPLLVTIEDVR
jgi:hypothetical protein